MSANNPFDRRLRQAADRADREQEEEDDEPDRQLRPGRGTEDRVVEREPSPEPEPAPEPQPTEVSPQETQRRPDRGPQPEEPRDVDVRETVEKSAGTVSEAIDTVVSQDVPLATDPTAQALGVQEEGTREISPQEQAAAQSSLSLLNVPQTALGLAGAGEFAGARLGEVDRGEEEEAFETTEEAAEQAVGAAEEAVRERPFETAGAVAGSLALSGGIFGAASRIGPRAGGVTRAAIQPGEELIGQVGGRTTRAVAGERAAERLFPQNEPVFLSEETVLRGVERGVQAGVDIADRTTVRGFGAGFPALEVETEQERQEPEDFRELDPRDPLARPERNERLRERSRFRGRDRTDLGPNRRGRARRPSFETEIESELETETSSELADLRVQTVLDDIVGQTQPGGRFGVRELPRTDQAFEPAVESALEEELRQDQRLETRQEGETEAETRARAETRTERPVEVEPIELEEDEDEDRRFFGIEFEGVREIEAVIDPTDLEVD